jgi:hypothetical protein
MIARGTRAPSGITLTEILIAILIMGVGLISLATLFPLGLLRLREATRSSRGGLIYETAADDMDTRALFFKPNFTQTWYWTIVNGTPVPRDPFVQDAINASLASPAGGLMITSNPNVVTGQYANGQPLLLSGLPFCYDPLWRSITGVVPNTALYSSPALDYQGTYAKQVSDARFGAGVFGAAVAPYLRADPSGTPSAWGIQRLTQFIPWSNVNLTPQYAFTCQNFLPSLSLAGQQPIDVAGTVFASNDDIVFNAFAGANANAISPLVPDMSVGNQPQTDYRFTWFVTGRQCDAGGNGAQFTGEVVVCDGRPFGYDQLPGQTITAPAGETVVEAIFGYGNTFPPASGAAAFSTSTRTVLLRWNAALADPQVRVGGWICDVTYEPDVATYRARSINSNATLARCYWYQIGKRTEPGPDLTVAGFRSMVVTLTSPVKEQTLLSTSTGQPVHNNAALIMPSVINVYPRAFEVH